MKRVIILIGLIILSSCRGDFDWDYARMGTNIPKAVIEEYETNFAEQFGDYGVCHIDAEHNWGFVELPHIPNGDSAMTKATISDNVNSNEWGKYLEVPGNTWVWQDANNGYYIAMDGSRNNVPKRDVTEAEIKYVSNWFKTHKNPESLDINWSDYFVQQVYSGHGNMDYLLVKDAGGNYVHIQNFNATSGDIQYMTGVSTSNMAFHCSYDNKTYKENSVIVYLDFIGEDGRHYSNWYVGFDYEHSIAGRVEQRDYYFDDWIVKIDPGLLKPSIYTKRIMCEDLGTTDDFDFNDVVFDVAITNNKVAIIVLRAAGGTLPLYIHNDNNETHSLFGVDLTEMVNTGPAVSGSGKCVSRAPVIFRTNVSSYNPIDINLVVSNKSVADKYKLDAPKGKAPRKICVDLDCDWTNERQNINDKYSKFNKWVSDESQIFWK